MIESDFYREYSIDLSRDLGRITWRRFIVYLCALSPDSALYAAMRNRPHVIEDEAEIAAYLGL